jgi:hypothetical protein
MMDNNCPLICCVHIYKLCFVFVIDFLDVVQKTLDQEIFRRKFSQKYKDCH